MTQAVSEELLVVYHPTARMIFQTILWPTVMIGLIGNLLVVLRILITGTKKTTPLTPFYRSALLSLAFTDILLLVTSGTNVLVSTGNNTILWSLPVEWCTVIPYLQTVSILVASLTLAAIAIDRYAAFKSKLPLSKGLDWRWTAVLVIGLWIVAFAASYPVLGTYAAESLVVYNGSAYYMGTLCITANRADATVVYTILFTMIFAPLALVFILVHVLLARNISQRNSPSDNVNQQQSSDDSQLSNENSTVSTNLGKPNPGIPKKIGGTPSHVARKKRTVRVILVLIIVFAICRLPHWSFLLFKIHTTTSKNYWWYIQFILTLLSLFNAALHPFLYAFLNEALSLITWMRERYTMRARVDSPRANARPISEEEIDSSARAKVPRGPYHSP